MNTKTCTKCNKELPATKEYFHANKGCKYGLNSICKRCKKENQKPLTEDQKKRQAKNKRDRRARNPEKIRGAARRYCKIHRDKINARERERYQNNEEWREKKKARSRKHHKDYSDRRRELYRDPERRARIAAQCREKAKEMRPAYVASCMRMSVKDMTPEIYETKKLIIQLRREIKKNK